MKRLLKRMNEQGEDKAVGKEENHAENLEGPDTSIEFRGYFI